MRPKPSLKISRPLQLSEASEVTSNHVASPHRPFSGGMCSLREAAVLRIISSRVRSSSPSCCSWRWRASALDAPSLGTLLEAASADGSAERTERAICQRSHVTFSSDLKRPNDVRVRLSTKDTEITARRVVSEASPRALPNASAYAFTCWLIGSESHWTYAMSKRSDSESRTPHSPSARWKMMECRSTWDLDRFGATSQTWHG